MVAMMTPERHAGPRVPREPHYPHGPIAHGGKSIYGAPLGILMLEARFPRIPATWAMPSPGHPGPVQSRPRRHPPIASSSAAPRALLPDFLAAAADLVDQGAEAITTNCGFLSLSSENSPPCPRPRRHQRADPGAVGSGGPPSRQAGRRDHRIRRVLDPRHLEAAGVPLDTPSPAPKPEREVFPRSD